MTLRVAVVGAGSWGTTVAALTTTNAEVVLWARRPELAKEIEENRRNPAYLAAFELPEGLRATASMEEAISDADVIVMGVPSHGFRAALEEARPFIRPWVPVVSLAKGLEQGSLLRMTEVVADVLPSHPTGVLTGPNLAKEVMVGHPTASVIALRDAVIAAELQKVFSTRTFRVYTNPDVIGCELAGVLKNVIAIAIGMADGMGFGDNTRATIITRGLAEITRLGVAMGGDAMTFAGLAGMGDLVATCSSSQSRNHTVGEQLGRGRHIDEIVAEMSMVAEGVKSAPSVLALAHRHHVEMPIAEQVAAVVSGRTTAPEAFVALSGRSAKPERYGV